MSHHDHTPNLDTTLQTISPDDLATTTGATGIAQLKSFAEPFAKPFVDLAMPLAQPFIDVAMPLAKPFVDLAMPLAQPFVDLAGKIVPVV